MNAVTIAMENVLLFTRAAPALVLFCLQPTAASAIRPVLLQMKSHNHLLMIHL